MIFEYRQIGGKIRYPLDTFIFVAMTARIYLIFRVLRIFSLFNYEYTDRFIDREEALGAKVSYSLIMKSLLKQKPYIMLSIYFIMTS